MMRSVASDQPFKVTMMEHVHQAFTFWKTDIVMTLQFVGPPLANMRIAVLTRFGPNVEDEATTIPISELSGQYATVFNYGIEDTLKVTIPYVSPLEWMLTPVPEYASVLDPRAGRYYATGIVYVVLVTPYQVNDTMAQELDMNVFLAAGSNCDFKTPGENLARITSLPIEEKFEMQMETTQGAVGGQMEDDEKKEIDVRPLGGPERISLPNDGTNALWDRAFVLDEVAWPEEKVQGEIIWQRDCPFNVLPAGAPKVVVRSFRYMRTQLEFSFALSTSISSQGQLLAFFSPLGVDSTSYSLQEVLLLPHVLLKAGRTTAGVVKCPFVHPMNALIVDYGEGVPTFDWESSMGTINLMVFNQFKSGSATTDQSPTVNISVKFIDMQLSVPNETVAVVDSFMPQMATNPGGRDRDFDSTLGYPGEGPNRTPEELECLQRIKAMIGRKLDFKIVLRLFKMVLNGSWRTPPGMHQHWTWYLGEARDIEGDLQKDIPTLPEYKSLEHKHPEMKHELDFFSGVYATLLRQYYQRVQLQMANPGATLQFEPSKGGITEVRCIKHVLLRDENPVIAWCARAIFGVCGGCLEPPSTGVLAIGPYDGIALCGQDCAEGGWLTWIWKNHRICACCGAKSFGPYDADGTWRCATLRSSKRGEPIQCGSFVFCSQPCDELVNMDFAGDDEPRG
jgi:hypothetical protein